jgi:hypothetical protein
MTDAAPSLGDHDRALALLVGNASAEWSCHPREPGLVLCRIGEEFLEFRIYADAEVLIDDPSQDVVAIEVRHRNSTTLVLAPEEMNPALLATLRQATPDGELHRSMLRARNRSAVAALERACHSTST